MNRHATLLIKWFIIKRKNDSDDFKDLPTEILTSFVDTDCNPTWFDIWAHIFDKNITAVYSHCLSQVIYQTMALAHCPGNPQGPEKNAAGFWSSSGGYRGNSYSIRPGPLFYRTPPDQTHRLQMAGILLLRTLLWGSNPPASLERD